MTYFVQYSSRKAGVSRDGVMRFNAQWPGSTLRDRTYWFEFDHHGDLIDTDLPEHDDGPAATALAVDVKRWLDGVVPRWAR